MKLQAVRFYQAVDIGTVKSVTYLTVKGDHSDSKKFQGLDIEWDPAMPMVVKVDAKNMEVPFLGPITNVAGMYPKERPGEKPKQDVKK